MYFTTDTHIVFGFRNEQKATLIDMGKFSFLFLPRSVLSATAIPFIHPFVIAFRLLLITNNLASVVGDTVERRQFQIAILANYIYKSQEIFRHNSHQHRHVHDTNVLHCIWLRYDRHTYILLKRNSGIKSRMKPNMLPIPIKYILQRNRFFFFFLVFGTKWFHFRYKKKKNNYIILALFIFSTSIELLVW